MSAADFLVEIGTEELPPKALQALSNSFRQQVEIGLSNANLTYGSIEHFATPRRLALLVHDLSLKTPEQHVEKRGPAWNIAFDDKGNPTKALEGFLHANNASAKDCEKLETNKGDYVLVKHIQKGQTADALLPDIIEQALKQLPIPRMMRWADHDFHFVRPVKWILMLHGSKVVKAELFGCKASNKTYGHRYHHPEAIEINEPKEYLGKLEKTGHVIASFDTRKLNIEKQIHASAKKAGGQAIAPEALLDEVTALVEWPEALRCQFDPELLKVPQEALISAMQNHQKSFAIVDNTGKMLPSFITISNIKSQQPKLVIAGNQKVMAARLNDAKFFYEQDLKMRLEDRAKLLSTVTFQKQLGTLEEKANRVRTLSNEVATQIGASTKQAETAATLCKADLMSEMVREFPELQGTMGKYYALAEKHDKVIADAIEQHYWPSFSGDAVPETDVAAAAALADKLDTLVGIFGIGQKPTGTKDPFALRRAAIGLIRIIIEKGYTLPLRHLIENATKIYHQFDTPGDLLPFILERLKVLMLDQHVSHGVLDAVLSLDLDDLSDIDKRIKAVQAFEKLPEASSLAAANKRVSNILSKATEALPKTVNIHLLVEPAEKDLHTMLSEKQQEIKPLIAVKNYPGYLKALASLREPIDVFFDNVMVMVDDPKTKQNRLALLAQIQNIFSVVADISKL